MNDQGARSLLAIYKENLTYAELKAGDKVNLIGSEPEEEPEMEQPQLQPSVTARASMPAVTTRANVLQEIFNLDEGPVTLAFPSNLSPDSYEELEAGLQFFLRRAKRRAQLRAQYDDPEYIARREAEIRRRANRTDEEE